MAKAKISEVIWYYTFGLNKHKKDLYDPHNLKAKEKENRLMLCPFYFRVKNQSVVVGAGWSAEPVWDPLDDWGARHLGADDIEYRFPGEKNWRTMSELD